MHRTYEVIVSGTSPRGCTTFLVTATGIIYREHFITFVSGDTTVFITTSSTLISVEKVEL